MPDPKCTTGVSVCEQYRLWALEAVEEWDGQCSADLLDAIAAKHGVKPQDLIMEGREPTENERHLWNLLTWRSQENTELAEEVKRLREHVRAQKEGIDELTNVVRLGNEEIKRLTTRRGELVEEKQVVEEQLEVAIDRAQSWKNLADEKQARIARWQFVIRDAIQCIGYGNLVGAVRHLEMLLGEANDAQQ